MSHVFMCLAIATVSLAVSGLPPVVVFVFRQYKHTYIYIPTWPEPVFYGLLDSDFAPSTLSLRLKKTLAYAVTNGLNVSNLTSNIKLVTPWERGG